MKKIIAFLTIGIFVYQGLAQTLSWGPDTKVGKIGNIKRHIKVDDKGSFLIHKGQLSVNKISLQRFNLDNKLVYEESFKKALASNEQVVDIFHLGKQLYLCFASHNKKSSEMKIYSQKIDLPTGKLTGEKVFLEKLTLPWAKYMIDSRQAHSPDGTKVFIGVYPINLLAAISKNKSAEKLSYAWVCLTEEKGKLWSKVRVLDLSPKAGDSKKAIAISQAIQQGLLNMSAIMDLSGNTHVLDLELDTDEIHLMSFDVKGEKYRSVNLNEYQKKGYFGSIALGKQDEIMVIHTPNTEESGLSIVYIDKEDNKMSRETIVDLTPKQQEMLKEGPSLFNPIQLRVLEDASKIILWENTDIYPDLTEPHVNVFEYGNINLIKLDAKDRILWTQTIEKEQKVKIRPYLGSYFLEQMGNEMVLVFQDHIQPGVGGKSETVLVRVAPEGEQERKILFTRKDSDYLLHTEMGIKRDNNTLDLLFLKAFKFKMLRLDF